MSTFLFTRKPSAALAGILLCLPLLGGQQAPITPPPSAPGAQKSAPDQKNTPAPTPDHKPDAAGSSVDTNTYKIGPSDVLVIKVWNEDKFSGPVTVHQDGKITLPLVGDLPAGNTTPKDVEKVVADALTKYVVKPLVTVTVEEVGSKKYYLIGQISHAGEYPLAVPTTVLDAIGKAGGLLDFANEKKIYILRGDKKILFNYKEVRQGKHLEQNIMIEPGDHIFFP
jgi:polysaccharide biosynthesis/export protein